MPEGWTDAHDEALLIVVDKFGLDSILGKLSTISQFENVLTYHDQPMWDISIAIPIVQVSDNLSEKDLLRRVIEICTTLESGKWNGKGSTEIVEDEEDDVKAISALQRAAIVAAAAMDSGGSGRSTPKGSYARRGGNRRRGKDTDVRGNWNLALFALLRALPY